MSISTYGELKTAVASWMHRDDLTSSIPDFIQQGEALLNRKLRTLDMENVATLTASTISRNLSLPSRFAEMQSLQYEDTRDPIQFLSQTDMSGAIVAGSGRPRYFTLKSDIEFDTIPASAYSIECRYFKKYDIASDLTNTLISTNPEIYLHASLAAASLWAVDDARLATFKTLLAEEIDELNKSEDRKRGKGLSILRTEIPSSAGFHIIRGDL